MSPEPDAVVRPQTRRRTGERTQAELAKALRAAEADHHQLRLRLDELGMALREKQEEFLDILDRLQQREEQSVRRSEERFRLLVESVQDYAILMLGPSGAIISWNEGASRITGFDEDAVVNQHIQLLYPAHAVTAGHPANFLEEAASEGKSTHEDWLVRRDGALMWASVLFTALRDERGRSLGFAAIIRDLTERRRAEEALRRTAVDLERSNRELEQFAFVASHDLQEPLRKIQAFGERLHTGHAAALPEQAQDYISRMRSGARRMQTLIDDILVFSRITSRTQPLQDTDLADVAREAVIDLEHALAEAGGRVDINKLPRAHVDRAQMRRVFQNLIGNALKFHRPETQPVVTVEGETLPRVFGRPLMCRVLVRDNGIGFDAKYAERIFGIFERLHGRLDYPGTGMGLAICRKIVERHSGTIRAEASPGSGATFVIELPVTQATGGIM